MEFFDENPRPRYEPFTGVRKPYYFPMPWGEHRWKEWSKTPMASTPGPRRVYWADIARKEPRENVCNQHEPKSCFIQRMSIVSRYTEKSTKPQGPNARSAYVSHPPTPPEDSEYREEEPQGKRVRWSDTRYTHLHYEPYEKMTWKDRLNLVKRWRKDREEAMIYRAEELIKPGPHYMTKALTWVKVRVLKLPTPVPAKSSFKSCLKVTTPNNAD